MNKTNSQMQLNTFSKTVILLLIILTSIKSHSQNIKTFIKEGNIEKLKELFESDTSLINKPLDSYGWTPLLHAVESKNKELVEFLIASGADINKQSRTRWNGLTRSVEINHKEFVDFFYSMNSDVPLNDDRSTRFIHKSARAGYENIVMQMIKEGEDIHKLDVRGNTLLHSASIGGLSKVVTHLIENGLDVKQKNNYELNALHFAVKFGHYNVVKLLVENNANIHEKTILGMTPIQLAIENGFMNIVIYLENKGANNIPFYFPELKDNYLGQEAPGMEAILFAPGIISAYSEEHGVCAFSKDGNEVFWPRKDLVNLTATIMYMKKVDNVWQKPQEINSTSQYLNVNPALGLNDSKIYYGSKYNSNPEIVGVINLIYHERTKDGWSEPIMPEQHMNSLQMEDACYITSNGTMYLNSSREGGYGSTDIYKLEFKDGKYQSPENIGSPINTNNFNAYPYVSDDESYIIYESYHEKGFGGGDLFISFKDENGNWMKPVNMGDKVNTDKRETFPRVSPDGKFLFFGSNRKGDLDIYWIDARVIDEIKKKYIKN